MLSVQWCWLIFASSSGYARARGSSDDTGSDQTVPVVRPRKFASAARKLGDLSEYDDADGEDGDGREVGECSCG